MLPPDFVITSAKFKTDKENNVIELILEGKIKNKKETITIPGNELYIGTAYESTMESENRASTEFRSTPEFIYRDEFEKEGINLSEISTIRVKKSELGYGALTLEEKEKWRKYQEKIPIVEKRASDRKGVGFTEYEIAIKKFNENRVKLKEYFKFESDEQEKLLSSVWANGDATCLLLGTPGCVTEDTTYISSDGKIHNFEDFKNMEPGIHPLSISIAPFNDITSALHIYEVNKTIEIITKSGRKIRMTPNHPLLIENQWRKAEDLKIGDKIFKITKIPNSKEYIPLIFKYYFERLSKNLRKLKYPEIWNEDLGSIFGAFVAEGSILIGKRRSGEKYFAGIKFSINPIEKDYINNIRKKMYSLFGISPRYMKFKKKNLLDIKYCNVALGQFFAKYNNKNVPKEIMSSPNTIITNFLSSLFEGDGCASYCQSKGMYKTNNKFYKRKDFERRLVLVSKNYKLLQNCQILLLKFEIDSTISKRENYDKRYNKNIISYGLRISGKNNLENFKNNIDFLSNRKKNILNKMLKYIKPENAKIKNKIFDVITKKKIIEEKIRVYDLEIPQSHTFIANGLISHNTGKSFYVQVSPLLFCNGLSRDELYQAREQWRTIVKQIDDLEWRISEGQGDPDIKDALKEKMDTSHILFREIKDKMRRHIGIIKMDQSKEPGEIFYELNISIESPTEPLPYVYPKKTEYRFEPAPKEVVLKPVKFFNECNRTNPSTANALLGLLAEKEIEYLGKLFRSPNNNDKFVRKEKERSYLWADIDPKTGEWKPQNIPFDMDIDIKTKEQRKTPEGHLSWLSYYTQPFTVVWADSNPHVAEEMDRALLDRIDMCLYFSTITMDAKESVLLQRYEEKDVERTENIIIERIITPYEERIEPLLYEDIERLWRSNRDISIKSALPIISLSTEIFNVAGYYFNPKEEAGMHTEANKLIDWSKKDFEMAEMAKRRATDYPTSNFSWTLGLRVAESLTKISRTLAMINLRKEVTDDEIRTLLPYVTAHRYGLGRNVKLVEHNEIVDYYPNLQFWIKKVIVDNYLYDPAGNKQKLREWLGFSSMIESAIGIKEKARWIKEPDFDLLLTFKSNEKYNHDPIFQRIYDNAIGKLKELTSDDVKNLYKKISDIGKTNYMISQIDDLEKKIHESIIVKESVYPEYSDEKFLISELNLLKDILHYNEQISDTEGIRYMAEFLKKKGIKFDDKFKAEEILSVKDGKITIKPSYERTKLLYLSFSLNIKVRDSALEFVNFIKLCKEGSVPENKVQIEKLMAR